MDVDCVIYTGEGATLFFYTLFTKNQGSLFNLCFVQGAIPLPSLSQIIIINSQR